MRLLLLLLPVLLPLATARGEVPASRLEAREHDHRISAVLDPLDEHARGARQVRTGTVSLLSPAEAAARLLTPTIPGVRIAPPSSRRARTRGLPLVRGHRAASRGEYVPYFPTAPPVTA